MALSYSKGELSLGETIVNEGLNGEQFKGKIIETKEAGSYLGVVPEISGSTHITGHHLVIDLDDQVKTRGVSPAKIDYPEETLL
jgi:trans-L-3-hydroxyproline dehydratase